MALGQVLLDPMLLFPLKRAKVNLYHLYQVSVLATHSRSITHYVVLTCLDSGIKGWIDAGVPAEKINAGLAYYGRAIETTENMKNSQYASSKIGAPKGDSDDAFWQDPYCQVDAGGFSGIWKWKNLRSQGVIGKDGKAGNGFTKHWDSVSQTPWLYNEQSKTFISYEDPESIKRKVDSALCLGIGGVMAW